MFLKTFIIGLFLSASVMAANLPPVVNVSQGGFISGDVPSVITPLGNTKRISVFNTSGSLSASGNYFSLVYMGGAGGAYQVANTGLLECFGAIYSTSAIEYITFGYGDTAVTDDTATAPTNPVEYIGSAASPFGLVFPSTGFGTLVSRPIYMTFPANKFPFFRVAAAGGSQFSFQIECSQL